MTVRGDTVVEPTGVRFRVRAPGADGVRLELDFDAGTDPEFTRYDDVWQLDLPRPAVDRLEYQFALRDGGNIHWILDPGNPRTVENPFGLKSEVVFPGYRAPGWAGHPAAGTSTDLTQPVPDTEAEAALPVTLWRPEGLADGVRAPLLVAHDGTDMAERGLLLRWASHRTRVAPVRLLLLDPAPGRRNDWYGANPSYAARVAGAIRAARELVSVGPVIGLGASLGAVAMMTVHRHHPGVLHGLALQSGSFFTMATDPQESGHRLFDRLCAATAAIRADPPPPVPTLIAVGAVEENRANNEQLAAELEAAGWPVRLSIFRDAHTMIGWRDAWFPDLDHLIDLTTAGAAP